MAMDLAMAANRITSTIRVHASAVERGRKDFVAFGGWDITG